MPKISIIMPIYNVEQYLEQCLDSCINQTLEDIEVICVNDGSSDNSLQILENYAKKDARIKIINQENQGISETRNNGFKSASGDYILFLDSDDWLKENACEIAYNQIIENNNDFVYFSHLIYSESTGKYREVSIAKFIEKIKDERQINLKKVKNANYVFNAYVWNKLYKRQWLIKNNICFIEGKGEEDLPYTILVYLNSNSMSYIKKPLYIYRERSNSLTWTVNINNLVKSRDIPIQYISNAQDSGNMFKVYLTYYFSNLCHWYVKIPLDNDQRKQFKELILKSFYKLKGKDPRADFYIFLLKSNLVSIYMNYIKWIIAFFYRLPFYIRQINEKNKH